MSPSPAQEDAANNKYDDEQEENETAPENDAEGEMPAFARARYRCARPEIISDRMLSIRSDSSSSCR